MLIFQGYKYIACVYIWDEEYFIKVSYGQIDQIHVNYQFNTFYTAIVNMLIFGQTPLHLLIVLFILSKLYLNDDKTDNT